jgi:probable addiction module antidote protein
VALELAAPFDAADHIKSPEAQAAFLAGAFETSDRAHIANALGTVARAYGIAKISRETGLTRTQLYGALSRTGNPTLETLLKVLGALGMRLMVERP